MRLILFIVVAISLYACSNERRSFASEKEFLEYINNKDNGYIQSTSSSELVMEIQVVPPLDSDSSQECSINMRLSRKDELPVLETNGSEQDKKLEAEGYLAFEILSDVSLEDGEKVYTPIFNHYERNYGLKPSVDVFFEFKKIKATSDLKFIFRDHIFDQGLFVVSLDKKLFKSCHVE